jgi:integrase
MPRYLLSVKKVDALKAPGRYGDGGGLYLSIGAGDARSWIMRIMQHGKRHDIGLGSAHFVTLAEAREAAEEIRAHAKRGGDVGTFVRKRREQAAGLMTVERAADLHFEEASKGLAERTRDMWKSRLVASVYPVIGTMRLEEVTSSDIKRVLQPIWTKTPDTAHRVRARLHQMFAWAIVEKHHPGPNPVADVEAGMVNNSRETKHHEALPWADLPAFAKDLAKREGTSARCLEFIIHTGARSGEARGARWDEFDFKEAVWIVPAERMKGPLAKRKLHRVALSAEAIALVQQMRGLHPELVFPSPTGKELSDMVFKSLYKRMGHDDLTTHGFRATFTTWAAANDICDPELVERALAHVEKDNVRRAYQRGDLLDRRYELMGKWSAYITGKPKE